MTKEEVLALPAGRELDAKIHHFLHHRHTVEGEVYCMGDHHRSEDCEWLPLPKYSTDIAAAWEVVEVLERKQIVVRIDRLPEWDLGRGEAVWQVVFDALELTPSFKAEADTAPLAICRAALLTTL
jgi:hypothetical protein